MIGQIALVAALAIGAGGLVIAALTQGPPPEQTATPALPSLDAPTGPLSVTVVGDSYAAGAGTSAPEFAWVNVIANERQWDHENFSTGGTGYVTVGPLPGANTYADRLPKIIASTPDVVIFTGGRNDVNAEPGAVDAAARAMIEQVMQALPDVEVAVTSPLWDDDAAPERIGQIALELQSAAEATGAVFVDIGQPLAGQSALVVDDGVHPNDAGHALLAQEFASRLEAAGLV